MINFPLTLLFCLTIFIAVYVNVGKVALCKYYTVVHYKLCKSEYCTVRVKLCKRKYFTVHCTSVNITLCAVYCVNILRG